MESDSEQTEGGREGRNVEMRTELGGFLTDCSFDSNRRSISSIKAISFVGSFSCTANSHSSIQLFLLSPTIMVPSGITEQLPKDHSPVAKGRVGGLHSEACRFPISCSASASADGVV